MLYGNAVQNYYVNEVRKLYAERKLRLAGIRTKKDAEAYVQSVRAKIKKIFHLPAQKTPLNPVVTGTGELPGMEIRKIIYESRPGYPVTGLLFVPEKAKKAPGVLFVCGHAEEGKASCVYQTCAVNLASQGFVVLMIDPVNQGERLQFSEQLVRKHGISCTVAHCLQGKQLYLEGEFFGSWRAWDAVRGIDYLLTLPEVDPSRIGMTGNSGGGTMTAFVNALEDRLTMAAPSCYVTTWLHEVENELPADAEQMPPGTFREGLDMADFLIARAPRPLLIMGQKNDFFDPRGTMEAFQEVKTIYSLLGKEENVRLFIGPDSHGYTAPNRAQMYAFFNLHGLGKKRSPKENSSLKVLPSQETWVAPEGSVRKLKHAQTLACRINGIADRMIAKRKKSSPERLRKKLISLLQPGRIETPYYRVLRPIWHRGEAYAVTSRFALETEAGQVMSILKLYAKTDFYHIPESGKAILYIPNLDSETEIRKSRKIRTEPGEMLFALDVRGIGEMLPAGCDQWNRLFFAEYHYDYHYASLGNMFRRPVLGGRVRDILCALELLKECGVKKITLLAEGQGTVPALLAAFLSDIPAEVKLQNGPESWESMVRTEVTHWPLSCMLPGILGITDLPELRKFVRVTAFSSKKEPSELN